jgi:thymidylate synthase
LGLPIPARGAAQADPDWIPEDAITHPEEQWRDLLRTCLGAPLRPDRTEVGTHGIFGAQMRFDLREGFPAFTSKRLAWEAVVEELAWFLRGSTDVRELQARGVHIWDANALAALKLKPYLQGTLQAPSKSDLALVLGPIYGQQWRGWGATYKGGAYWQHDQIASLVLGLILAPESRRHVVSSWNVQDLPHMALPPCHVLFQAHSAPNPHDPQGPRLLSLSVYQRSCDLFLGVPFNVASYALLLCLLARWTEHTPHELVWFGGDVHLYANHTTQAREVLARTPRALPSLDLHSSIGPLDPVRLSQIQQRRMSEPAPDLFAVDPSLARLVGYDPHPAIKAPMAV